MFGCDWWIFKLSLYQPNEFISRDCSECSQVFTVSRCMTEWSVVGTSVTSRQTTLAGRTLITPTMSVYTLHSTLFMVALCNRAGRIYFHPVVLLSFFPRLISAVGDWMSTIFPRMVWPYCKFIMQVWNVLRAALWKYSTQKVAKKSPSGHHPTTLSGYIFATKARIDNRKKAC